MIQAELISNEQRQYATKYYKVTDQEALKVIHEFVEKRAAFLQRVQDFIKDFNLKSYVLRDNLFYGKRISNSSFFLNRSFLSLSCSVMVDLHLTQVA